jgi:hypothetical protein
MIRRFFFLFPMVLVGACSLNPQPLPPQAADDDTNRGGTADASLGSPDGATMKGDAESDAGIDAPADATCDVPEVDSAVDAPNLDANLDAPELEAASDALLSD